MDDEVDLSALGEKLQELTRDAGLRREDLAFALGSGLREMWQIREFAPFDDIKGFVFGKFEAAIASLPRVGEYDLKLAARTSYNMHEDYPDIFELNLTGRQKWFDPKSHRRHNQTEPLLTYAYCRRHVPEVAVPHLTRLFGAEWKQFAPGRDFPDDVAKAAPEKTADLDVKGKDQRKIIFMEDEPGASDRQQLRVEDWPPLRLGINPSIRMEYPKRLLGLPAYIQRDFDDELRKEVRKARKLGGLILLVGSSCSGKGRSAYEAIRAEVPEFRLLFPDSASEVVNFAQQAAPIEGTVLWLHRMERYFGDPDGLTTGTVRSLLGSNRPIIVMGTLLSEWYDRLVSEAPTDSVHIIKGLKVHLKGVGQDSYVHAGYVLRSLAVKIDVRATFSNAERFRAKQKAKTDRRIRVALNDPDGFGITQVLSGAPELIRAWRSESRSNRYGVAVITAAIDLRRMGIESPLPISLLKSALPAQLKPNQIAETPSDWFDSALAYARRELKGATSALLSVPLDEMGSVAGLSVANYLLQYGLRERACMAIPAEYWSLLTEHQWPAADLRRVSLQARRGLLLDYAEGFLQRASDDPYARFRLGHLYIEQGRNDEARLQFEEALSGGYLEAVEFLAGWYDPTEITRILERAIANLEARVAAGEVSLRNKLIRYLVRTGKFETALEQLRAQGGAEDVATHRQMAQILSLKGADDAAIAEYRLAASLGDEDAQRFAANLLAKADRINEAIAELRLAIEAGNLKARMDLIKLFAERNREDEATREYLAAIAEGVPTARTELAKMLARLGKFTEAATQYEIVIAEGDVSTRVELARLYRDLNRLEEAVAVLRLVSKDDSRALYLLANFTLQLHGRPDEAIMVWREAIAEGHTWALRPLAQLLGTWHRIDEAIVEYWKAVELGDRDSVSPLARLLESKGMMTESTEMWHHGIDIGSQAARRGLAEFLVRRGRIQEAVSEYKAGILSCDPGARRGLLELLERTGRIQQARNLVRTGLSL
jgi:tetratricopeptide (TPR) repeat protein